MVVHSILYIAISIFIIGLLLLKKKFQIYKLIKNASLFLLIFICATAFIMLPYLVISLNSDPLEGPHILSENMLTTFSKVASLPKSMLMDYHVFWWPYVNYTYPLGTSFFVLASFFSILLFTCALFDKNDWSMLALLALVILFFFSKGDGSPFPDIYKILNFDLPVVGWLLRVPMKFAHIIPFFFSLLFLRFSVYAFQNSRYISYAFIISFIAFNAIFAWPFFTGDMDGHLEKTDFDGWYGDKYSQEIKLVNSTNANLLNYTRNDPSSYSAWVNSSAPFLLSHDVAYDPLWIAYVNGHEYKPISSHYSTNAYYINETGEIKIMIEYLPQQWFYVGGIIGILGILVSIIYIKRFEK
jgi:hypothetical protein